MVELTLKDHQRSIAFTKFMLSDVIDQWGRFSLKDTKKQKFT